MSKQLTVGLLKQLSEGHDIPALESFLSGRKDDEVLDLLNRNDYIATTLWSREDIASMLEERGIEPSEENIDAVLDSGCLKYLGDCNDEDWMMINDAITHAFKTGSNKDR